MNYYLKKTSALLMAAALMLAAAGCGSQAAPAAASETDTGILATVQSPQKGTLELETSFIGTVEPDEMVSVFAKLPATVEKINFKPGDPVSKGDVLFELDDQDVMTSVKTAQAAYRSAAAQVDQMTGSSYKNTLQQLDTAYDTAYENYKDAEDSFEKAEEAWKAAGMPVGTSLHTAYLTTKGVYDQMETLYKNARKSYNINAEQGYAELTEVAAATLNQAQVALDAAMEQLDNCKVRAPIDGVVESVSVSELNMAGTTSPAFVISNKEVITVSFSVSSTAVLSMAEGDLISAEKGQNTYRGVITEVGTMASAQNGLFPIKAVLEDPGAELLTGVSVKVSAVTEKAEDALILPQNAVYYDDGRPYIYVLDGETARKTYIETGVSNADEVAVVSGVSESDRIITSWHPNLVDGARVLAAQ